MKTQFSVGAIERSLSAAIAVIMFISYAPTVNPSISFLDNGELITTSVLLGIPHPTGYPLFTIVGRIVAMAMPIDPAYSLNLFAALLCAVAVSLFFALMREILRSPTFEARGERPSDTIACAIGSVTFGWSTVVWAQAISLEVYSLHLVLVLLYLLLLVKGLKTVREDPRRAILSAFVLGLGFGNHMTTLFVLPASIYLIAATIGFRRASIPLFLQMSAMFLLAISVYLVLPVRSSSAPPLDWGHPAELQRLIWHISGKQYQSWIFSGFDSASKQLSHFLGSYPQVFSWFAITLTGFGMWTSFVFSRKVLWFVLLLSVSCIAYAINYDIPDIDSYFLLTYVGASMLIVLGVRFVLDRVGGKPRWLVLAVLVTVPAHQYWAHRAHVDESGNTLVSDYALNILSHVDSNAVIFTYQWDYFVSPSYYFRHVRRERPDVVVIDKELLRRSWYFLQLERSAPWLLVSAKAEVDAFLAELRKFENDLPYHGGVIEARFNEMINALIQAGMKRGPVYFGAEMEPQFAPGMERVPDGLLLRIVPPGDRFEPRSFSYVFRETRFRSRLESGLRLQYAKMFTLRALWAIRQENDISGARTWLGRALEISHGYAPALTLLGELNKSL